MAMDYDIFSDIVAARAPASVVHEDDTVMAVMTIGPVNPGHVLVIPKERYVYLNDLDEETGAHLPALRGRFVQDRRGLERAAEPGRTGRDRWKDTSSR